MRRARANGSPTNRRHAQPTRIATRGPLGVKDQQQLLWSGSYFMSGAQVMSSVILQMPQCPRPSPRKTPCTISASCGKTIVPTRILACARSRRPLCLDPTHQGSHSIAVGKERVFNLCDHVIDLCRSSRSVTWYCWRQSHQCSWRKHSHLLCHLMHHADVETVHRRY